ncbi:MAG: hypothetical protein LLG37_01505 [Spirochaetia bacterium]|nr:hypothetical protein [Spirochaetia bacterium]
MGFWKRFKDGFLKLLIKLDNGFLCDTCRFNHPNDCTHSERPNAKECGEYERKR